MKALELEKSGLLHSVVKQQVGGAHYDNDIMFDNRTKSTDYHDNNSNNANFSSSNRGPSNDSSSFEDEDKEVAMTFSLNAKNGAHNCSHPDSPEIEK